MLGRGLSIHLLEKSETVKLRRSGLRSISPVVDITNFVLLELGQPLHAFDMGKLSGGIHVRHAKKGESLTLLDDQKIKLTEGTMVIADDSNAVALAGIMGGADITPRRQAHRALAGLSPGRTDRCCRLR